MKALANLQPGDQWRAEHRKKFESRTRSSVEAKLLQRRGAELLVEPHQLTLATATAATGGGAAAASIAGAATGESVDEPLCPPPRPLDAPDANAEIAHDTDDETPSLFPRPPAAVAGPAGAAAQGTGGEDRAAAAADELPNEARYPAFCRAVDPAVRMNLPDLQSVLQRVEEDGTLPLIPTDQLDFASADDSSEEPRLLAAFGATPTGPLYHARRYDSGSQQPVSVLVLREPQPPSADGQLASSVEQQAHESAAERQRATFYDDLRFLGRHCGSHPNIVRCVSLCLSVPLSISLCLSLCLSRRLSVALTVPLTVSLTAGAATRCESTAWRIRAVRGCMAAVCGGRSSAHCLSRSRWPSARWVSLSPALPVVRRAACTGVRLWNCRGSCVYG